MKRCSRTIPRVLAVLMVALALTGAAPAAPPREDVGAPRWRAGLAAYEDGLLQVAEAELLGYLRAVWEQGADPAHAADALVLLTRSLLARGQPEAALSFIDEHRRMLRETVPGGEAFCRAMALYQRKDIRKVLKELENFDREYPNSPFRASVTRLRAWCRWHEGDVDGALQLFEAFEAANPGSPEVSANRSEWGQMLISAGRLDEAERVLTRMPTPGTDPRHEAIAGYWRARILLDQGRAREAVEIMEGLVYQDLGDPDLVAEAWFGLAQARLAMGDRSGAANALNKGLAVARGNELILRGSRRLGLLYLAMGRLDEGLSLLRQFVTSVPDHPRAAEAQLAVAQALLTGRRHAEADAAFQYYLESFTNTEGVAEANRGRGWALFGLGRFTESAAAFEKAYGAFTNAQDRQVCLFKAGDAVFTNAQYNLARDTYERLIREYPDSSLVPMALYQAAQCYALVGNADAAESTYLRIVGDYPGTPLADESLLRLAQLRESTGSWGPAEDAYTVVITQSSNAVLVADAWLGRGLVRYRLLRYAEALADFRELERRYGGGPQADEAAFHIVMCEYMLGHTDEAVAGGMRFLEEHPAAPLAPRMRFWLGQRAFNAGDYTEAERLFTEFSTLHRGDPECETALLWAARATARQEEYLRALELLSTQLRLFPTGPRLPEARFEQGNALAALGKYPEAILAYQEVVNRAPASSLIPETWLRLGDCQFLLGLEEPARYETAINAYTAAAGHPIATVDLRLEAEYKIGRCLQKLERTDAAIEQLYRNVMTPFLERTRADGVQSEAARMWFVRAARDLADIFEARQEWKKVVNVLERALSAGLPDEAGIQERIRTIRAQHWWEFY